MAKMKIFEIAKSMQQQDKNIKKGKKKILGGYYETKYL